VRIDVCDVLVLIGSAALITGLFLVSTVTGLVGGGAVLIIEGLGLAWLHGTVRKRNADGPVRKTNAH